jgi:Uma2 family endonuclease
MCLADRQLASLTNIDHPSPARTAVAELIAPLMHSPLLPEAVEELAAVLRRECPLRQKFYEEMTPEMKVEFIDGEVILHSPARNKHLSATSLIHKLLAVYVDEHELGEVKIEKCLVVFPRNDYEPDVVFFDPAKVAQLQPGTMKFPIPDLIVEVLSESTEARDRGVKLQDYEAHGVAEYWIVDTDAETVEQHLLHDGRYTVTTLQDDATLTSTLVPGFNAKIAGFFEPRANALAPRSLLN